MPPELRFKGERSGAHRGRIASINDYAHRGTHVGIGGIGRRRQLYANHGLTLHDQTSSFTGREPISDDVEIAGIGNGSPQCSLWLRGFPRDGDRHIAGVQVHSVAEENDLNRRHHHDER